MSDYATNFLSAYGFDSNSGVFEPDVMLPSQFLIPDEQGLLGGERRLMAALLSDGIEAYINQVAAQMADPNRHTNRRSRARCDAGEWIDTVDESYVFSFDNVCECLGINPDYLRLGLWRYIDSLRNRKTGKSSAAANEMASVWKKIRRPRKQ